jgi:hypothetical protein
MVDSTQKKGELFSRLYIERGAPSQIALPFAYDYQDILKTITSLNLPRLPKSLRRSLD